MKYFDLHCDTLFRLVDERTVFSDEKLSVNKDFINEFDMYYQFFAVWTPKTVSDKTEYLKKCLRIFKTDILPNKSDTFKPFLSIEGADFLCDDTEEMLSLIKEAGVISLSLTWNYENALAGGVNSAAGLKPLGREVIGMLNKNGIVLDVSHLNRKSFYDAICISDSVIATHTYINELYHHKRNLTIEQIKLIKEKNGLVGLCFYPEFFGTDNVFEAVYKALIFCLENQLGDTVAFGSDFDGAEMPLTLKTVPDLYNYLSNKGIDKKALDRFFFLNAFNRFKCFDK